MRLSRISQRMQSHPSGRRVALFLLALLPFAALLAQPEPTPAPSPALSQTVLLTPPPTDGPLVIQAGFQILEIDAIDDQSETFQFSGILTVRWKDPRFAFDPVAEGVRVKVYQGDFQFNEIATGWYPEVVLLNVSGMYEQNGVVFRLEPDGTSTLVQAINATAKTKFSLRRYPFDYQQLKAVFAVLGYTNKEIDIQPLPQGEVDLAKIDIPQWELKKISADTDMTGVTALSGAEEPSTLVVKVDLRRKFMFIMRLVVMPLFIVVVLSWCVFWMDRSSVGDRMSVSFVALLTVVAYQIMLGDILPHIAYLTIVNLFLNFSFLVVCGTIVINLIVGELDRKGRTEAGNLLDIRCRRIFPIAYLGLMVLAFLIGFGIFR